MHCCNYVTRVSRQYYFFILPPAIGAASAKWCESELLDGVYYVNCLFIITNKYSIIVVSALYIVLNYNVYKLDCSMLLILLLQV